MQLCLLDQGPPRFDPGFRNVARVELGGGAFIERGPRWIRGHDALYRSLRFGMRWQAHRRRMYERTVDVPRLSARVPQDGEGDGLLRSMADALSGRHGTELRFITMALYRDGRDSVAWHRDRFVRDEDEGLVAIVSLGEPRTFLLRPLGGGRSLSLSLGWGDLLVMGGTTPRTFEHCVPKVRHAGPRLSVMFRAFHDF